MTASGPTRAAATSPSAGPTFRIGIDIGGTWIKGACVDLSTGTPAGEVRRLLTPSVRTADAVGAAVKELIDELAYESLGSTDMTIGVAIPSIVRNGVAWSAANIDASWIGLDVRAYLEARVGLPICVVNDADAAGLAEARYGAGRNTQGVVLVLTLGTGIGSALIVDGQLVPNTELGHLEIDGSKAESRASAVAREKEGLGWMEYAGRLQRYLSHVEFLLTPDLIILGGGISACSDAFLPHLALDTPVVPAALENSAGVVGAALQTMTTHHAPAPRSQSEEFGKIPETVRVGGDGGRMASLMLPSEAPGPMATSTLSARAANSQSPTTGSAGREIAGPEFRLRDIARMAGVSTATVSRVINQQHTVAASTRARVELILNEVGFERNEHALALQRQRVGVRQPSP